ncbi:MAG: hypothetical protein GXP26_00835 [Planctomycetes bacterium]|nr:hypothetical protein [Planctomycetota bacterium]
MNNYRDEPLPLRFSTSNRPAGSPPETYRKYEADPLTTMYSNDSSSPPHKQGTVEIVFWTILFTSLAYGIYLNFLTF